MCNSQQSEETKTVSYARASRHGTAQWVLPFFVALATYTMLAQAVQFAWVFDLLPWDTLVPYHSMAERLIGWTGCTSFLLSPVVLVLGIYTKRRNCITIGVCLMALTALNTLRGLVNATQL